MGNPGGCTNNFPQKGCGLGHVTPKIYGIQSNISSKIHELETSNVVPISATLEIWAGAGISFSKSFSYRHRIWHVAWSFVLGKRSGRTNKFPQNGRGLGHVTPQICGIRTNIFSKVLQLETSNLVKKKPGHGSWESRAGAQKENVNSCQSLAAVRICLYLLLLTMLQENSLCFRDDDNCNGLYSLLTLFALVKNF